MLNIFGFLCVCVCIEKLENVDGQIEKKKSSPISPLYPEGVTVNALGSNCPVLLWVCVVGTCVGYACVF